MCLASNKLYASQHTLFLRILIFTDAQPDDTEQHIRLFTSNRKDMELRKHYDIMTMYSSAEEKVAMYMMRSLAPAALIPGGADDAMRMMMKL